jgi:hypothetical protein
MQTINVNMVPDNSIMYIKGVIDFSHITKRLEGAELERDNARKIKNGMMSEVKPHTRITISQASVDFLNPATPTLGEQFISEKFYNSKKNPEKNALYKGVNKSMNLPDVYIRDEADPTMLIPVSPEKELATGMKVTLMVRVFPTKLNKGVSLDAVICDEPIRYAGTSAASSTALTANGFTVAEKKTEAVAAQQNEFHAGGEAVAAPAAPALPHIYTQPVPLPVYPPMPAS